MDAAFAAMNFARMLTLQWMAVDVSGPPLSDKSVRLLLEQAESLTLEAHSIAMAGGDATQAAAFVNEILEILKPVGSLTVRMVVRSPSYSLLFPLIDLHPRRCVWV